MASKPFPPRIAAIISKPEDKLTVEDNGVVRLWNRTERFLRLQELNAPIQVLMRELALIHQAAIMIDPVEYGGTLARAQYEWMKQDLGFCDTPDCEAKRIEGKDYCQKHQEEWEEFNRDQNENDPDLS